MSTDVWLEKGLLASGSEYGDIRLFNYPCPNLHATSSKFIGHSNKVTNVLFTKQDGNGGSSKDEKYLISTGGDDKCIF